MLTPLVILWPGDSVGAVLFSLPADRFSAPAGSSLGLDHPRERILSERQQGQAEA
jgi:hypothetical protein